MRGVGWLVCLLALVAAMASPASASTAPAISALSDDAIEVGATLDVTITGTGFTTGSRVSFSTPYLVVLDHVVVSDTEIVVRVKADLWGATHGTHTVRVTNTDGSVGTCECFTVFGLAVHSATPATMVRGTTGTFAVTGARFRPDTRFLIGHPEVTLVSSRVLSDTAAEVVVSTNLDMYAGVVAISAINPDGQQANCDCISVTARPLTISSVSPPLDVASDRATITIRGTGFGSRPDISILHVADPQHDIWIHAFRRISDTYLEVDVHLNKYMRFGRYSIWVTNRDRASASCIGCLPLSGTGYWMLGAQGMVYEFGAAAMVGRPPTTTPVTNLAAAPTGQGYWLVSGDGTVRAYGTARHHGGNPPLDRGEFVSSISPTPTGTGYWLFTNRGRALAYGNARHHGDMAGRPLNGPVLGSVATPSGSGYYMVAADGGIFTFGDARFSGSMGGKPLNGPVVGLAPDPDGHGYWLVANDGGIFAFDAGFRGSMGGKPLNKPVVGMVPYGDGYLMVANDGGIFSFSDKPFHGSLGNTPPADPIIAVAPLNG